MNLPSRIILSRKGTDGTYGGAPSLLIGNDPVSIPIPEHRPDEQTSRCSESPKHLTYGELPPHPDYGAWHQRLKGLNAESCVHLDPDIRRELRAEQFRDRPLLFGQSGQAEKHLRNQAVGSGDLFLFFGWFRGGKLTSNGFFAETGPNMHIIWGWLQVGKRHTVANGDEAASLEWAAHHPHVKHWKEGCRQSCNALYEASQHLSFLPHHAGAGVFQHAPGHILTHASDPPSPRSLWSLPSFFLRTGLTYHSRALKDASRNATNPDQILVSRKGQGQEFVFPSERSLQDQSPEVQEQVRHWLLGLYKGEQSDHSA